MTSDQFSKLVFGNVISNKAGNLFMVQTVLRDASGNAIAVGLLPAISPADAAQYDALNNGYVELFVEAPDGKTVTGFVKDISKGGL